MNYYNETNRSHNGINFRIESFTIPMSNEVTVVKFQAFYKDMPISEIEGNQAIAIMQAIKTINENIDLLK